MSFALARPSFAVGMAGVVANAPSSASFARSALLRWLSDLRSPLNLRSVRLSGGVPDLLLSELSGRLMSRESGVLSRLMLETDLWL